MDRQIDEGVIAFGEIGLGGEIRSVSHINRRIREAERLGFGKCIVPGHSMNVIDKNEYAIEIVPAASLKQAFKSIQ